MNNSLLLELQSRGLSPLISLLFRIEGHVLTSHYQVEEVVGCGGSGIICKVRDKSHIHRLLAGKFSFLSYHNPSNITLKSIRAGRKRIRDESLLLGKFKGKLWPKKEILFYSWNPLLSSAWGTEICKKELYLLMEWIEGTPLSSLCREHLNMERPNWLEIEQIVCRVAHSLIPFLIRLYKQGYLYTDLKPEHIVITKDPSNPIRLLDAGGTYKLGQTIIHVPITPCYLLPEVYQLWKCGKQIVPDESWIIHGFGKTLLTSMCNREMLAGYTYNVEELLPFYTKSIREYIKGLLQVRWKNLEEVWEVTQIFLNL